MTVASAVANAAPWMPYRGDNARSPSIFTTDAAATAIAGVATSRVVKQNFIRQEGELKVVRIFKYRDIQKSYSENDYKNQNANF